MTQSFVLHDSRALLDAAIRPSRPEHASSVAEAIGAPGLALKLRAHTTKRLYEAWLWEGNDGQAYFSKRLRDGRTLAWKPGATIERALHRTKRTMQRTEGTGPSAGTTPKSTAPVPAPQFNMEFKK